MSTKKLFHLVHIFFKKGCKFINMCSYVNFFRSFRYLAFLKFFSTFTYRSSFILLYTPYSLSYNYLSGRILWSSIWGTSGAFGFILVSVSTSVLINGHKNFDFRRLYSPKFPRQPHSWIFSNFRRPHSLNRLEKLTRSQDRFNQSENC